MFVPVFMKDGHLLFPVLSRPVRLLLCWLCRPHKATEVFPPPFLGEVCNAGSISLPTFGGIHQRSQLDLNPSLLIGLFKISMCVCVCLDFLFLLMLILVEEIYPFHWHC